MSPAYQTACAQSYADVVSGEDATKAQDPMRQALELLLQSPQLQGNHSVAQALQGALAQLEPQAPSGTLPDHEAALAKVRSLHLHRANTKKFREESRLFSIQKEITAVQDQLEQLQAKMDDQKDKLFDAIHAVSKAEALQYGEGTAKAMDTGDVPQPFDVPDQDLHDMDTKDLDEKSETGSMDSGDKQPSGKKPKRSHGQIWVQAEQARILAQLSSSSRRSFGAAPPNAAARAMPYQQTAVTVDYIRNLVTQAQDAAPDRPGFQQALMESLQCL
jgi:hypothetical protein